MGDQERSVHGAELYTENHRLRQSWPGREPQAEAFSQRPEQLLGPGEGKSQQSWHPPRPEPGAWAWMGFGWRRGTGWSEPRPWTGGWDLSAVFLRFQHSSRVRRAENSYVDGF